MWRFICLLTSLLIAACAWVCACLKCIGSNVQIKLTQAVLFFTISHSSSVRTSIRSEAHSVTLWFLFCSSIFHFNLLASVPSIPSFLIFTEDTAQGIHCTIYSVCASVLIKHANATWPNTLNNPPHHTPDSHRAAHATQFPCPVVI